MPAPRLAIYPMQGSAKLKAAGKAMAFKVGDVVRLKSGGADMTVTGDGMMGEVVCVWHSPTIKGGHDTKTASYPAEALVLKSDLDAQYLKGLKDTAER